MLRRFWLLFAQAVTVLLALWFIVATLKPEWLHQGRQALLSGTPVAIQEVMPDTPMPAQSSYRNAVQRAQPAVVNIFTSKSVSRRANPRSDDLWFRFFFGDRVPAQQEPVSSLGSGVIVSSEGYVLTNHHVVEGADEIEVALADGRKQNAKVVGSDPETDIAVLKISLNNLPSVVFGRPDNAKVGDVVLAIGNPFGVGQTVTMGIISALGRSHLGINTFENFIQTDAAINPGNSGGALIDVQGNLLGINTAIYSKSGGSLGIGFAIPVSTAKMVMESIITNGSVVRGWIGVEPQEITPELAESFGLKQKKGVLIAAVMQGGPADVAGIKPGDILFNVNGQALADTTGLLNTIAGLKPGSKVPMTVLRKGKDQELSVEIGKRPSPIKAAQ